MSDSLYENAGQRHTWQLSVAAAAALEEASVAAAASVDEAAAVDAAAAVVLAALLFKRVSKAQR